MMLKEAAQGSKCATWLASTHCERVDDGDDASTRAACLRARCPLSARRSRSLWYWMIIEGHNTSARNGPIPPVPPHHFQPLWKGGGSLGNKTSSGLVAQGITDKTATQRVLSPTRKSAREWHDPSYSGVAHAEKFHGYVKSGGHFVTYDQAKPSYRQKHNVPIGVEVGKGGNLGQYSKAHAGWDTKSSVTLR